MCFSVRLSPGGCRCLGNFPSFWSTVVRQDWFSFKEVCNSHSVTGILMLLTSNNPKSSIKMLPTFIAKRSSKVILNGYELKRTLMVHEVKMKEDFASWLTRSSEKFNRRHYVDKWSLKEHLWVWPLLRTFLEHPPKQVHPTVPTLPADIRNYSWALQVQPAGSFSE